jgi:hypothetical protein
MAHEKRLQENLDTGKLWTAEGNASSGQEDAPQYKNDTAQGTRLQETQKGQTFRKRRWMGPECNNDTRDRGLRQQLQGSMQIKNPGTRWQLPLKMERTSEEFDRKAFGLEFVKWVTGISNGLWKMRNCNFVEGSAPSKGEKQGVGILEGSTPPKQKKTLLAALAYEELDMWEHQPLQGL